MVDIFRHRSSPGSSQGMMSLWCRYLHNLTKHLLISVAQLLIGLEIDIEVRHW